MDDPVHLRQPVTVHQELTDNLARLELERRRRDDADTLLPENLAVPTQEGAFKWAGDGVRLWVDGTVERDLYVSINGSRGEGSAIYTVGLFLSDWQCEALEALLAAARAYRANVADASA